MAGALEGDIFVGPKAEEHRGLLSIRYPMEHGIVTDWNDMERIWTYIYSKDQLSTFSEEHPVLLTEAPLNPRKNREKAAEIFFETFNVPAWFVSMQAVLSLYVAHFLHNSVKFLLNCGAFSLRRYATGRVTGVVLDSGDGVTHAVPIYEGFAMPNSIMRVDIAGRDVTRHLRALIRKEGFNFRTTAEFEIVRSIKEKVCYLATNSQKEEGNDTEKITYTLPDGNSLDVNQSFYHYSLSVTVLTNNISNYRLDRLGSVHLKSCSGQICWVKNARVFMKCSCTPLQSLIWTLEKSSIKISYCRVVQHC